MSRTEIKLHDKITQSNRYLPFGISKKDDGTHYVHCLYEASEDDLILKHLGTNKRIAHFHLTNSNGSFKRHLLYSKSQELEKPHIITASGYIFTGPVEVYSWMARESQDRIEDHERDSIETLGLIDMFHVSGEKRNKTAGFPEAIARHLGRINGFCPEEISLEEALEVFDSMLGHVPKW